MIRCGMPPYLECSSKGDKRFSAFYARLEAYDSQTIESIYQAAKVFDGGVTGLSIEHAKGKRVSITRRCRRCIVSCGSPTFKRTQNS